MNESNVRAFPATVAHVKGSAVKFSSGNIVVATAGTDDIVGTISVDNEAGYDANVVLRSASGTAVGLAGGNVAIGDYVTATTGGDLIATTTAGDQVVGIAITAAADTEYFEYMPSTGTFAAAA